MLLESAKETQQNGMQKVFVKKQNSKHLAVTAVPRNQPAGWQVATFVVRSRLRFAKNIMLVENIKFRSSQLTRSGTLCNSVENA